MSSDDYAQQIAQKYSLAIAIAILNIKPENMSIDEHIDQIKRHIHEKMDDDNISVCSDDFILDNTQFNDNSQNINQNRLPNETNNTTNTYKTFHTNENEILVNATQVNDTRTQDNDNGSRDLNNSIMMLHNFEDVDVDINKILVNATQVNDTRTQDNDNGRRDLNNSIMMLHNFEDVDVNKDKRDQLSEVIQVLKGVDVTNKIIMIENHQQTCESILNEPFDPMDTDLTQCFDENCNDFFDTIDILPNIDNILSYEHSYGQNNIEISPIENVQGTEQKENSNLSQVNSDIAFKQDINTSTNKRVNQTEEIAAPKPKIAKKIHPDENKSNSTKCTIERNANTNQAVTNDTSNDAINNSLNILRYKDSNEAASVNVPIDTQETLALTDYMQHTHYSQSQLQITIDNKLIYGSKSNISNQKTTKVNEISNDIEINIFSQNSQDIFNKSQNFGAIKNVIENDIAFSFEAQNVDAYFNKDTQAQTSIIENDTAFSLNAQGIDEYLNDNILKSTMNNENTEKDTFDNSNVIDKANAVFDKNFPNNGCTVFDETTDNAGCSTDGNITGLEDLTDTQLEKVPFKIIKEMNEIKMYLNKQKDVRMEYSSNSQSRCSLKSSQRTNLRIDQSASSVFNYLTTCALVTQDLTEQISESLGQLIDRLHEEGEYPPFIEELLNTVQNLLQLVYEGESNGDALLKKDELIQRVILLNKSTHIQKYTIEKINSVLQKLLELSDDANEVENLTKMENICYIFHILQVILQKYSKNSSQSTQNSQDEKTLRKKDISDLWRRKWIPNYKENSNEGSLENKCVLKECSAILNKIIVSFMEGYSLIAFCALKCFNIMQS